MQNGEHSQPGTPAPLTDRVNSEPPIINGMTMTEAAYLGSISLVASFLCGLLCSVLTGYWLCLLILCIVGPLISLWYASLYLQKIKRGQPEGTYIQKMRIWFADMGLIRHCFTQHKGFFSLGCALGFDLFGSEKSSKKRNALK